MVTIPFSGTAPAAFRRPLFAVSFGSGSVDDWRQSVTSITVECCLAPAVDVVEVSLAAGAPAPTPAVGDAGSVSLGYEDDSTALVFTGQVHTVRHTLRGATYMTATNGGATLSQLRINQSYEDQKAGDMVNDLAGQAGVDTETVSDGLRFPFYALDDRRSAYQHIAALAVKCDYLACISADGKLTFAPATATQPVQTFTYGQDILSLHVAEMAPAVGEVTTVGEGAAGSAGQEAWSWLIKDPASVTASAGSGTPTRQQQDASLRSNDAVQGAADGMVAAAGLLQITGSMQVPGAPAVVVGSMIEIAAASQEALNGLCLVRRVRHSYTKHAGFTTLIMFSKTGNGGLGGVEGLL